MPNMMRLMSAVLLTTLAALPTTLAQTGASPSTTTAPSTTFAGNTTTSRPSTVPSSSSVGTSGPPDVYLNVPELHVGKIELDVDNLQADINLNAKVASLVTLNAGVAVSIEKVNITIADVDAELELVVRLGHLVDIVNRVFSSLDLNPLLINTLGNATNLVNGVVDGVVSAVDGLLGSITQGGKTVNFIVDSLGNIISQVDGGASTIVGNYLQNMTATGTAQQLGNGLKKQTYSYSPLNSLVDVVTNTAGQVVQAVVQKKNGGSSSSASASATSAASSTVAASSTASATST